MSSVPLLSPHTRHGENNEIAHRYHAHRVISDNRRLVSEELTLIFATPPVLTAMCAHETGLPLKEAFIEHLAA